MIAQFRQTGLCDKLDKSRELPNSEISNFDTIIYEHCFYSETNKMPAQKIHWKKHNFLYQITPLEI